MRIVIGLIICLTLVCGCGNSGQEGLSRYLPLANDLDQWQAADTVVTYVSQDLFLLINGGAEMYHRHGFVQVASQTFEHSDGHQITIECYEMNSPEGAREVYRSKISDSGEGLSIGDEAMLNGYYLNFYQSNFLVTLVGFDSESATVDGLKAIAEWMSSRMGD